MADLVMSFKSAEQSTANIKRDWNDINESVSKTTESTSTLLDNELKSIDALGSALKEVAQLSNSLDALKKSLEGFDSSKALIDSFTILPDDFFQQLEEFNRLATQSSAADTFAKFHSQLADGTITLEGYIARLTRTVKELEEGEAAAKEFFGGISKNAETARTNLKNLAESSLTELVGTFKSTLLAGGDIGAAISVKLKDIGISLLDKIIENLLNDSINALFNGTIESFGSGITGFFNNAFSILSKLFSNILGIFLNAQGNVFGPQGVMPFAHGGIVSQPTLFGFAKGIGLMGEAGAEAIMPLGRDSRGNLGVRVADNASSAGGVFAPHVEINVENKGGGDMSEEQARTLGTQVKAIVEMQVAKQMYEYMRNGTLRPSMGRGY